MAPSQSSYRMSFHRRAASWLSRRSPAWSRQAPFVASPATEPQAYEMFGVLAFLEHVPDRARAEEAFERIGPLLLSAGLVELDPAAEGETHGPLAFAALPNSIARRLFDPAVIEAHLARSYGV